MTLAIQVRSLSRRYGGRWALRGVDLEVMCGRTVMLFGANGSGKTTLLRILGTALRPGGGDVRLFGEPWGAEVRDRITLLSHADGHYDDLTARENLALMRRPGVDAALDEVGLAERGEDRVRTFSAGMRKRLGFARILLKRAPMVLLDEPYAALDPAGASFVDALILRLRGEGVTLVVSTHQVTRSATLCDDALKLEQGKVVWSGAASDVAEPQA